MKKSEFRSQHSEKHQSYPDFLLILNVTFEYYSTQNKYVVNQIAANDSKDSNNQWDW